MKHGIRIPAMAVRLMAGALAATAVAAFVLNAPGMMRYVKMAKM